MPELWWRLLAWLLSATTGIAIAMATASLFVTLEQPLPLSYPLVTFVCAAHAFDRANATRQAEQEQ